MNSAQTALVAQTARVLLMLGPDAFDAFYSELFRIAPDARALFRTEPGVQKLKLMDMVASLISAAQDTTRFLDSVHRLGERHRDYGVRPEHHHAGSLALLACLEAALGADFTPEVRTAWLALYADIRLAMASPEVP